MFGFIKFTQDLILLSNSCMGICSIILISIDRQRILCFSLHLFSQIDLCFPQFIDGSRQAEQRYQIIFTVWLCELLAPLSHSFNLIRLQGFDDFIRIAAHAWVSQQEMIYLLSWHAFCSERYSVRSILIPTDPL